jgi:hypothetical protein
MSDFKSRLLLERDELQIKTEKLKDFICSENFNSLPDIEKQALREQFHHMGRYFEIVHARALRFCN